jgi:hypothetical protein
LTELLHVTNKGAHTRHPAYTEKGKASWQIVATAAEASSNDRTPDRGAFHGMTPEASARPTTWRSTESAKQGDPGDSVRAVDEGADVRQTLEFPQKSEDDPVKNGNTPGRIRTCDRRIRNPLDDSTNHDTTESCDDASFVPTSRADSKDEIDLDLQRVLDAWPVLPAALKTGILAMIDAARK